MHPLLRRGHHATLLAEGCDQSVPGVHRARGNDWRVLLVEKALISVLRHRKPTRLFWGDMTDLFQESVPYAYLDRCFAVAALTPHITHMFLTKRPERMLAWLTKHYGVFSPGARELAHTYVANLPGYDPEHPKWWKLAANAFNIWPLPNVYLGASVESAPYRSRIEALRETPAAVRFLSIEPMLSSVGKIDLVGIDWVICGGESGPGAQPMHPGWARSLRDQCVAAGVPFFMKQWGEWQDGSDARAKELTLYPDGRTCEFTKEAILAEERRSGKPHSGGRLVSRVGKKAAGRLLDGREWNEMPAVRA
jgi:protein gp37